MRGSAEIQVITHVEMTGDQSAHLQDILRRVRNTNPQAKDRSRTLTATKEGLSEVDKNLLDEFDAALVQANVEAEQSYRRIRQNEKDDMTSLSDPFEPI